MAWDIPKARSIIFNMLEFASQIIQYNFEASQDYLNRPSQVYNSTVASAVNTFPTNVHNIIFPRLNNQLVQQGMAHY